MTPHSPVIRPRRALWLAIGLLVACDQLPDAPLDPGTPDLQKLTNTDPTRVLTVGIDAPANLTLRGTVAGLVIAVDHATVDLSKAIVDCAGQVTPDDPRIGIWILGSRSHVTVKGGGTALVKNCGVGVLIGSVTPAGGERGGFLNRITGLVIQRVNCPSGPYTVTERVCDVAIALANSHDNVLDGNRITEVSEGGIFVYGSDPAASTSGRNTVSRNTLVGGFNSYGILVASNGNVVRDNVSTDPIEGIVVRGNANLVADNQISYSTQDIAYGIHLLQGAAANTIARNQIRAGDVGILVEANAVRNLIRQNTALAVRQPDAVDRNGNCTANTWGKNTFTRSDPPCIVGATIDAVAFTAPATLQIDAPQGAPFSATITNQGARLTDIALRTWITQGLFTRHAGAFVAVDCRARVGTLPRGTCSPVGNSAVASRNAGGSGTLAAGPALAVVELVHLIDGDTVVLDSRSVPVTLTAPATGSYWEVLPPLPTPRAGLALGVIDGVLYAVGGYTVSYVNRTSTETFSGAIEAYDPVTRRWTARALMPTPRAGLSVGVINGLLYAVGGYTANATGAVEAYNPTTNSWTTRASMPTPRSGLAAAVVNGVLYAIGGTWGGPDLATVEAYDPGTDNWATKASMPTSRRGLGAGVVDGQLYAVGGSGSIGVVEAYDPVTNSWTTKASMPSPRFSLSVANVDGRLYAVGTEGVYDAELVYDPVSNGWTAVAQMPTPRSTLAAGVVNHVLYAVGGYVPLRSIATTLDVFEAYHP